MRPDARTGPGTAISLALGFLIAVIGVAMIIGGAAAAAVFPRQADGFATSSVREVSAESYALITPPVSIDTDGQPLDLGTLRFAAESTTPDNQLFIGIGPRADVDQYLLEVNTTQIASVTLLPSRVEYRDVPGSAVPAPPAEQDFWTVSASGPGTQQITMDLRNGDWVLVIMNADARTGVAAGVQASVDSPLWETLTSIAWMGGIVVLIIGVVLIAVSSALRSRRQMGEQV